MVICVSSFWHNHTSDINEFRISALRNRARKHCFFCRITCFGIDGLYVFARARDSDTMVRNIANYTGNNNYESQIEKQISN